MINKIVSLKTSTTNNNAINLCENAIAQLSSLHYTYASKEAQEEIEYHVLENLFNSLNKLNDNAINEWIDNQKRIYSINNLGLRHVIKNIQQKNSHPTLNYVLESWLDKLNETRDIFLLEEFISSMSGYNYLDAVHTELSALQQRISNYKIDIDINKIVETMKLTNSYYLVPLIEDVVNNYIENKNPQTKYQLKETLIKFSYDGFIRDILNSLELDSSKLQLEYANSQCDIKKIYSPIQYIGENEVVFNVKGKYYVKRKNNISKLPKEYSSKLLESFKELCNIINSNNVVINENNTIDVYVGKHVFNISESSLSMNNKEINVEELQSITEQMLFANDKDAQYFYIVNKLHENFNNIAELDFVKRIYLKENENIASDIFKLRDNIFITTHDQVNKSTFYRNVNPIQATTIMKEHLNYDVSKLFADVLPQEEKILREMAEAKSEYELYMSELESKLLEYQNFPEVYNSIKTELFETKKDYLKFLSNCENYTKPISESNTYDDLYNELLNEELTITVTNDKTGQTHTVVVPDDITNSVNTATQAGSLVGAENVQMQNSDVTFNSKDSAALSKDQVNIPVDKEELEKEASEEEKKKETSEEEADKDKEGSDNDSEEKEDETEKSKKEEDLDDDIGISKDKKKNENLSEETPKKKKKVFVKKKLNESIQIGDKVKVNGKKGDYVGKMLNNDIIIHSQGKTVVVDPKEVTELSDKDSPKVKLMKFDELTQQLLFEQYVNCGIYENNIPIKINNVNVRYSDYANAKDLDNINVLVEGNLFIFPKNKIKIFEDVNAFANPTNYAEGYIIEGLNYEKILYNITDVENSLNGSDQIRIIRLNNNTPINTDIISFNRIIQSNE